MVAGCATTTSPTGRTQYVGAASQAQLDALGAKSFAELKAQKRQTSDQRQTAYVRCIVNTLVAALPAQARGTGWESAVFADAAANRSAERRVGQECVSTCSSRWSSYH